MIGKYLVNEQYILETSHWLITSPYEHEMTVNFINPASAVEVNQNGILVQPLRSNQMQSWFGRWSSERVKQGKSFLFTNYRPISLLPSMFKIYEYVVFEQLLKHMEDNRFFYKDQIGFRPGHFTELASHTSSANGQFLCTDKYLD